MSNSLKTAIAALLVTHGWTLEDGSAIASKPFDTAVGVKLAFAYVSDSGSEIVVLQGYYQSEGRNQLEAGSVFVPKSTDQNDLAKLVSKFATQADYVVSQTYAAKLLRA